VTGFLCMELTVPTAYTVNIKIEKQSFFVILRWCL
jgi:hypothetical protein